MLINFDDQNSQLINIINELIQAMLMELFSNSITF